VDEKVDLKLPDKKAANKKITDADLEHKKLDQGILGRFFGGPQNAPGNIAGLIGCLLVFLIGAIAFAPLTGDFPKRDFLVPIITLLGSTIGYLFGKNRV
jgi:hypothetical protein